LFHWVHPVFDPYRLGISVKKKRKRAKKEEDTESKEPEEQDMNKTVTLEIERKYSILPGAVQALIASGQLGKEVTMVEPIDNAQEEHSNSDLNSTQQTVLVSNVKSQGEDDEELIAPNARLICNLRRCQRKILPMLPDWVIVDVALSEYEMVLIDVNSDDGQESTKRNMLDALGATAGGKGLRMCDVVAGRNIVFHVNVAEVTSAMVEQFGPSDLESRKRPSIVRVNVNSEAFTSEYWKVDSTVGSSFQDISSKWERVTENRCRIVFGMNTLVMRFFADLDRERDNTSTDQQSSEALIWCQTIVRICGPRQLNLSQSFDIHNDLIVKPHQWGGLMRGMTQRFNKSL